MEPGNLVETMRKGEPAFGHMKGAVGSPPEAPTQELEAAWGALGGLRPETGCCAESLGANEP